MALMQTAGRLFKAGRAAAPTRALVMRSPSRSALTDVLAAGYSHLFHKPCSTIDGSLICLAVLPQRHILWPSQVPCRCCAFHMLDSSTCFMYFVAV
jgi:hypothetical protein